MVVDMILSQYLLFSMKFGHFIVLNFFREQAFSDRWTRPSTIWTDHPQPGLTVYIRDQLSTSGTNCLYPGPTVYIWRSATGCDRDRPSTYEGPRPLIYESPRPVTYEGRDWLQTKVATGYIQRVATDYIRKVATGSIWKSHFLFLKKVDSSVPNWLNN